VPNKIDIPLVRARSAAKKPSQASKPSPKANEPMLVNFAICLDDSNDADLVRGKTYRIINDRRAAADGYLRIVDESGGDYLYSNDRFFVVKKRMTNLIVEKLFP